jgi:hypothetical protein
MLRPSILLVLLCVSLAVPEMVYAEDAHELCGAKFNGRADLIAKMQQEQTRVFRGKDITSVLASSPDSLALWWLTEPRSRAYPAIACVEKRFVAGEGLVLRPGQVDCEGTSVAECSQLKRDISRAKF